MQPPGAALWHGLVFVWFAFVLSRTVHIDLSQVLDVPREIVVYGGPWKFLTIVNLLLQAALCGISLLVDVLTLMKKQRAAKFLLPFRDLLFGSLGFPLSMFVSMFFWIVCIYDRELIYPKGIEAVIPEWLNHAMHSLILPLALLELCIIPRRYPSKGKRLALLGIGSLGYISWTVHIYQKTGKWVYPIFHALNSVGIAALFLGAIGVCVFYSNMGAFLCRMIWGDTVVISDTSKKKSK
ncbi:androgen-dependent TFPI-regulating protein [Paroedura picta]|uniref:androgen-dependent TFPI-regulating protein n=1 Tax=Paroedura picta TaxID=143630 RepID=UPI00405793D2